MPRLPRLALLPLTLAVLALASRAHAKPLITYDLDSLAYLSDAVVEAELIEGNAGVDNHAAVRVIKVYAGDVKPDQTLPVTPTILYTQRKAGASNTEHLPYGSRVFLFLTRNTPQPNALENTARWTIQPGGLKLITDAHVLDLHQQDNPGPYVADVAHVQNAPTEKDARAAIEESVRLAKEIRSQLATASAGKDAPKLIEMLKARAARSNAQNRSSFDHIAHLLSEQLAATQDPARMDQALDEVPDSRITGTIQYRFYFQAGREYLLTRITNTTLPAAKRFRYAQSIAGAGYQYADPDPDAQKPAATSHPANPNHNYVRTLAQLAIDERDPKVADTLLHAFSSWGPDPSRPELTADLHNAAALLAQFYATAQDERLRYTLELAIQSMDPPAYPALKSPCGPIISILEPPANSASLPKLEDRGFYFTYSYRISLPDVAGQPLATKLILESFKTAKTYELTTPDLRITGNSTGGGSNSISVPDTVPTGRYRASLRFYLDNKRLAQSHSFDLDL